MEKEFNLSEEINYGYGCGGEDVLNVEDIKEFIRLLKYHLKHGLKLKKYSFTIRNEWKIIDELAGPKLITK